MWNNSKEYNKKNYQKYWGNPKAISDRVARNKARREAEKDWRVSKWDWKQVDHKKPLSQWGSKWKWNTRVISETANKRKGAAIANKRKGSWYTLNN